VPKNQFSSLFPDRETGESAEEGTTFGFRLPVLTEVGDYNAVKKCKVGKRVGRRVAEKATGKAMQKLFK
jgi:hypothetical protein